MKALLPAPVRPMTRIPISFELRLDKNGFCSAAGGQRTLTGGLRTTWLVARA